MAKHNEIGSVGEGIAAKWLMSKGFEIVERNYRKKWGEIDIVARLPSGQSRETQRNAQKEQKIHFIEVKTVSYETIDQMKRYVSRETWRPEDNVHQSKLERLSRAIQTWILDRTYEGDWQFDVITVKVVPREKYASIKLIDNIVLGS